MEEVVSYIQQGKKYLDFVQGIAVNSWSCKSIFNKSIK